jgi:outer membrane protein OmpA-like peptidoglycan-associated protein
MPLAALAQQDASELTVEELDALFSAQRTRGLVLAPVAEDGAAVTEETESSGEAAIAIADPAYIQIDPALQANFRVDFEFDSALLADSEKAELATLCTYLGTASDEVFRIVGHTDASGSESYNQRLSLLRAEEVKRFLVSDCGVAPERLDAVGVGEAFPFDPNDPRADANRRVEFQLGS